VKASCDEDTGVGDFPDMTAEVVAAFANPVVSVDGFGPPFGFFPPFDDVTGMVVDVVDVVDVVVVVVVAAGWPPQVESAAMVPENHCPPRRTSAWNLQAEVAGTVTVNVPAVPEAVPTILPWAHRFNVQIVAAEFFGATVNVARVGVMLGGRLPANAVIPPPSTIKRVAPMHIHNRFILLLLARSRHVSSRSPATEGVEIRICNVGR
jgi:hypothetical protein